MSFRDFDAERAERAREAGLTNIALKLAGQHFECWPTAPFGAMLDLAAAPEFSVDRPRALEMTVAFLAACVIPDEVYGTNIVTAARAADEDTLISVLDYIVSEYTGRPTVPSSDSAHGAPSDGRPTSSDSPPTGTDG